MGFKTWHKYIQDYQQKVELEKAKKLKSLQEYVDKGEMVDSFLKSAQFRLLKEVFLKLAISYEEDAVKSKDIKYIMKKEVFLDIENHLNDIVTLKENIQQDI